MNYLIRFVMTIVGCMSAIPFFIRPSLALRRRIPVPSCTSLRSSLSGACAPDTPAVKQG